MILKLAPMIPWRFWKFFRRVWNWRWRVQSPGRWESGKSRKEESRATWAWVGSTAFYHCSQDVEPSSKKGKHAILHHPRKSPSTSWHFCLNLPFFWFWLRTCLAKRLAKLEKGLERFDSGVKLSDLQKAKLSLYMLSKTCCLHLFTTFLPEMFYFQKLYWLRMRTKLASVMEQLRQLSQNIDGIYTQGVVDGFSTQHFYCK